jgi:hypothetical protein
MSKEDKVYIVMLQYRKRDHVDRVFSSLEEALNYTNPINEHALTTVLFLEERYNSLDPNNIYTTRYIVERYLD